MELRLLRFKLLWALLFGLYPACSAFFIGPAIRRDHEVLTIHSSVAALASQRHQNTTHLHALLQQAHDWGDLKALAMLGELEQQSGDFQEAAALYRLSGYQGRAALLLGVQLSAGLGANSCGHAASAELRHCAGTGERPIDAVWWWARVVATERDPMVPTLSTDSWYTSD